MARKPWPESVRRAAVALYGGFAIYPVCVVTQATHADLHHLDGDNENSAFLNAVPLTPSLNTGIERTPDYPLQPHSPESLFALVLECFNHSEYARAYGICRLVAFLAHSHYGSGHDVCRFAGLALEACRILGHPDLATDTIERNILPLAQSPRLFAQTPVFSLGLLCRTVGSWFCCLEDDFTGSVWYRRALRLLGLARGIAPHAEEEYLHVCRKLLHAWRMASGKDIPRLRERVEGEYDALTARDKLDSKTGDLVIRARSVLRHHQTDKVETVRQSLDALAREQFGASFDPSWLAFPARRPDNLTPWNWTGVVDVQAECRYVYDGDTDGAMDAIEKLFWMHHKRGGRVFRSNCGRAWRELASIDASVADLLVTPPEQTAAWRRSMLLLDPFARAIESRLAHA